MVRQVTVQLCILCDFFHTSILHTLALTTTVGVLKAGAGMAVGGLLGALMFRSGSGYRSASVAAGFGVALGSTVERTRGSYS
jgi:hypothetical protein